MLKITNVGSVTCLLACAGMPVLAANWTTGASVTPAVTYTDNVCLSSDDEKGEWIGLVTPAASVRADGNQANLRVNAAVELNSLSDSRLENLGCNGGRGVGSRDQFSPRVNGAADAVILEDWLFIDGTVNVYQNQISPFAAGGGDSLNRTGNTNTTYDYAISPYISHRFKKAAELQLRYTWDDQYNTEDIVGDNTRQAARALIQGIPGTSKLLWGIEGNYSEVSYSDTQRLLEEDDQDSELKSAQVNLGYQLNRSWQVNGYAGEEWNDFVSSRDEIDGTYWDVGLRWTPNTRTSVEVGNTDRFYGNSPRAAITHRHKHSTFKATYAETLTYDRNIRSINEGIPGFDPGVSTLSTSPILDERFGLSYRYQRRRTQFGINAFTSDQKRAENLAESTFRGVSLTASRKLSRKLSISGRLQWNEEDPKENLTDRTFDSAETWRGSFRVERSLSDRINLAFRYQYTDRQSDTAFSNSSFSDYTENRFTLSLRIEL